MAIDAPGQGFGFLFRSDRGEIDRATWWKGTIPIAVLGGAATAGWLAVRPFTYDAIHQPPVMAVVGYVYLVVFAFLVLLLFVCEYNLSAKRFHARQRPGALAAVLPGSVLLGGAFAWYLPRSQGALPDWTMWMVFGAIALIVLWNVVELGVRTR